jgi:membrane protein DedA with SNARE-associated domain
MLLTRYSGATILVGRFLLGLRTWASVLAGMAGMPFWTFQLYSLAGAVIWAIAVGAAGFYLGSNWGAIERLARGLGAGGAAAAAVLILAFLLLRTRASRIWP